MSEPTEMDILRGALEVAFLYLDGGNWQAKDDAEIAVARALGRLCWCHPSPNCSPHMHRPAERGRPNDSCPSIPVPEGGRKKSGCGTCNSFHYPEDEKCDGVRNPIPANPPAPCNAPFWEHAIIYRDRVHVAPSGEVMGMCAIQPWRDSEFKARGAR